MLKGPSSLMAGAALAMAGLSAALKSGADALSNAGAQLQQMPATPKYCGRFKPYTDKSGMSHGRSGDKLARKAMGGTVGLRHSRGRLAAWVSASVAKGYRHGRRP